MTENCIETCAECGKPFQRDQYNFWCNECGEKIETELIVSILLSEQEM